MEESRKIDLRVVAEARSNLDQLLLWVLRTRGNLTRHEIMREIFTSHGFSPSIETVDELLEVFERKGLLERTKNGLVSKYSLTREGRKHAAETREKLKILLK
jgi:DNA-binding PadR family transcriptional regulator